MPRKLFVLNPAAEEFCLLVSLCSFKLKHYTERLKERPIGEETSQNLAVG